jgi:hypothetical protein
MSYACKKGVYETRYISPDPCQFIKGGMIDRGLSDGIKVWYDMDYGNWEDPNNEGYDKNLRLFKD